MPGPSQVNEFVKRVRAAQIHIAVASSLRKQLPVFGKQKAQAKLLANLDAEFLKVQRAFRLPAGDFPDPYRRVSPCMCQVHAGGGGDDGVTIVGDERMLRACRERCARARETYCYPFAGTGSSRARLTCKPTSPSPTRRTFRSWRMS